MEASRAGSEPVARRSSADHFPRSSASPSHHRSRRNPQYRPAVGVYKLGAFGVPANAEALWNRVKSRPELAGHARVTLAAGKVAKLQAGGFASRDAAQATCNRLTAAGFACIVG